MLYGFSLELMHLITSWLLQPVVWGLLFFTALAIYEFGLGPGLSALGTGDISILTTAMTVAFDTTIIGLLAGVMGFVLGRMRRRWYDNAMQRLDDENSTNLAATTVLSNDEPTLTTGA